MNEVELIRAQLSLERQHAFEVGRALSAAGSRSSIDGWQTFRQGGVDYLAWILSRFEEREQTFHDLLRARAGDDSERRAVESALQLPGTSREALRKLEAALAADSGTELQRVGCWTDFEQFLTGAWSVRRDQLDSLLAQQARVTDWRAVSGIDADSIFDERSRYAKVRTALPAGIELR
ncbi:MAG TPA: hypothetical protein VI653_17675 [Steroidobacteraceae bacterium]